MVLPPAHRTTTIPATEAWDDDEDFDFSADDGIGGKGGLVRHDSSNPLTLRRPASFVSDVDIDEDVGDAGAAYSGSSGDHHRQGMASTCGYESSRTSRSGMSSSAHTYRSTDLTDPESSPTTSLQQHDNATRTKSVRTGLSPERPYGATLPISASPTSLSNPLALGHHHDDAKAEVNDAASSEHELDFELGDGVQQLHLAPSTLRQRPSSEVWDADAGKVVSAAEDQSNLRSSPSPSQKSLAESDVDGAMGDDEGAAAEPIEEGLDLPDSIFGKTNVDSINESPSARLRAILDARLRGQQTPIESKEGQNDKPVNTIERLAAGALDFDADTDVVTGLVITDDLDLSPSRLAAKSLSYKTRRSIGGSGSASAHTVPRSQQSSERQRPSGSNARTWGGPNSPLPTVILTNSSPASHDKTGSVHRSPPRALSSYSHAPGAGPRSNLQGQSWRGSDARSVSPSRRGSSFGGSTLGGKSPALLTPDAVLSSPGVTPTLAQQQQRNRTLGRKRSMPVLTDSGSATQPQTPASSALTVANASATGGTHALSRLMASTASSRAREAETAARLAARASPEAESQRIASSSPVSSPVGLPSSSRFPPSRPSTPVNGAVRYTLSTSASRARRLGAGTASAEADPDRRGSASSSRPGSSGGRATPSMFSAITASAAAAKDAARVMRRPARSRNYGTGHELDGFDDLPTNQEVESRFRRHPLRHPPAVGGDETLKIRPRDLPNLLTSLREGSGTVKGSTGVVYGAGNAAGGPSSQRSITRASAATPSSGAGSNDSTIKKRGQKSTAKKQQKPTLIRNLGGNAASRSRTVGDMRWNPALQRWEGNEAVLRAFDNVVNSSTRPALISPLAAPSLGAVLSTSSTLFVQPSHASEAPKGGVSSTSQFATSRAGAPSLNHTASTPNTSDSFGPPSTPQGTRIVGDMMFDPVRMCWLSMAGTEEPDVFAGLGDDDDDQGERSSGGERERLSSLGRPRRNSGHTAGEGWSSGWGGFSGREGRSSTAPTTDEEDEMSKSVGCSDSGLLQTSTLATSANPYLEPPTPAISHLHSGSSAQHTDGSGQHLLAQQQTLTARRIKSADLLRNLGGRLEPAPHSKSSDTPSSPKMGADLTKDEDDELHKLCVAAEARHRKEVRGFLPKGATTSPGSKTRSAKSSADVGGGQTEFDSRSHLYLLQRLAREAGR